MKQPRVSVSTVCLYRTRWSVLHTADLVEKVIVYIDGTSASFPVLGDAHNQLLCSISAIYCLMADSYFKVSEWVRRLYPCFTSLFHLRLFRDSAT
jgi:hypothetical protein